MTLPASIRGHLRAITDLVRRWIERGFLVVSKRNTPDVGRFSENAEVEVT